MNKLFFFGELPPNTVNGISLSNEMNLSILKEYFTIKIIEEIVPFKLHNKFSMFKLFLQVKNITYAVKSLFLNKYDYLYLSYPVSLMGSTKILILIIFYRIFNKKGIIVLHLHRGDFDVYIKSMVNKFIAERIFSFTNKLIVLSQNCKVFFNHHYSNLEISILRNTVTPNYNVNKKSHKKNLINILFLSNYIKQKGIIDLLEAFSAIRIKYPHAFLKCNGNFSDMQLKDKLYQYESDQIAIGGPIYGDEKFEKILKSDLLVLPSWNEGQPLVLLEAMALGIPVLATKTGDIPEMLGKEYPFLVEPRDIEGLKLKLIEFIEMEDASAISKNLTKLFNEKFSPKMHRENLINIFLK